jgi:hypothetical protein
MPEIVLTDQELSEYEAAKKAKDHFCRICDRGTPPKKKPRENDIMIRSRKESNQYLEQLTLSKDYSDEQKRIILATARYFRYETQEIEL